MNTKSLVPPVAILGVTFVAGLLRATNDEGPVQQGRPEAASLPPTLRPGRFVLLKSGGLHEGRVEPGDGVVHIRLGKKGDLHPGSKPGAGMIPIREADILFIGETLRDIVEFKLRQVPAHDVGEQEKVLAWLATRAYNAESDAEMRRLAEKILAIDPSNVTAKSRIQTLDARAQRLAAARDYGREDRRAAAAVDPSDYIASFKRAHGQEAFDCFKKLEMTLLRSCGNGCHSLPSYSGEFKLFKPRSGARPEQRHSALNLQSSMGAINLSNPNASPILFWSLQSEGHGSLKSPPIAGINDPNYQLLRAWVFAISRGWGNDREVVNAPERAPANPGGAPVIMVVPQAPKDEVAKTPARPQRPDMSRPGDDRPERGGRSGFGPALADDDREPEVRPRDGARPKAPESKAPASKAAKSGTAGKTVFPPEGDDEPAPKSATTPGDDEPAPPMVRSGAAAEPGPPSRPAKTPRSRAGGTDPNAPKAIIGKSDRKFRPAGSNAEEFNRDNVGGPAGNAGSEEEAPPKPIARPAAKPIGRKEKGPDEPEVRVRKTGG